MRRTAILLVVAALCGSGSAGVAQDQETTPTALDVPAIPAPLGLGSVELPTTTAEIEGLLAGMPSSLAGEPRTPLPSADPARLGVAYGADTAGLGPPLTLQAQSFAGGDLFPTDFTADQFVRTVAGVPDYGTEAYGHDGKLFWVRAATTVSVEGDVPGTPVASRPLYTLAWGDGGSSWLFAATASTPAGLDALVVAFVQAAGGQPGGTPGPSPAAAATPAVRRVAVAREGAAS